MSHIYLNSMQTFTRVLFYDKVKHWMMPYDPSKYQGFDYFWRVVTSSLVCGAIALAFTYPLDLIHTRICSDMSSYGSQRLYKTTFDCFNRTNLDEGRLGLYKGSELVVFSALLRTAFQLPIYSVVKRMELQDDSQLAKFQRRMGTAVLSSLIMTTILYPLDTLKKTMQTNGGRGFHNSYSSNMEVMTRAPSVLGLRGLYRGCHLYFVSSALNSYIQYHVYDKLS